ncbi:MAG: DUF4149 domain-containing protein [Haloferacaceae archaeon]
MAFLATLAAVVVDAALGLWLGSMVFFSFVGAPRVFAVLDEERAGRVVNDIFPRYYVFGVALGVVALVAGALIGVSRGFGLPAAVLLGGAGLGVALTAYARWVLVPAMDEAGDDAFERYHRRSVVLNGVTMLGVAAALVAAHFA